MKRFKRMALFVAITVVMASFHMPVMADGITEEPETVSADDSGEVIIATNSVKDVPEILGGAGDTGIDGDFHYKVNDDGITATITGYYRDPWGLLNIPSTIAGYKVTSIGNFVFDNCSGYYGSLTIPDSVTSIGNYAFNDCSGFNGSLTIPDSVTSIGNWAFNGCIRFNGSLTIGNSVTSIGERAFSYTGFTGSLTIPDSVTSIGDGAFVWCSHFTGNLTIGNSVTSIGDEVFVDCSGFTGSLTIPDSVTSIGDRAFVDCSGFTGSLTIPDSVTYIGGEAFSGCSGFTKVVNKSNSTILLSYMHPDAKWFNEATGEEITEIANGVAIRGDYEHCISTINGRGIANYQLSVSDNNGIPLDNTWLNYQFYDEAGNAVGNLISAQTNAEGEVLIQSMSFSNTDVQGNAYNKKYKAKVVSTHDPKQFEDIEIEFDITVNPLSFTQKWSLVDNKSLGVDLTKLKQKETEVENDIFDLGATTGKGTTLSISQEYDNGKRNLTLERKYNRDTVNVAAGIDFDVTSQEMKDAYKFSALDFGGEAGTGIENVSGLEIKDYDPSDGNSLKRIGLFLMDTSSVADGNVALQILGTVTRVAIDLTQDITNIGGCTAYYHVKQGATVMPGGIKDKTTGEAVASGSVASAEYNSKYSYGLKKSPSGLSASIKKDAVSNMDYLSSEIKITDGKKVDTDCFGGTVFSDTFIPPNYDISVSKNKLSFKETLSSDEGNTLFNTNGVEEVSDRFIYKNDACEKMQSEVISLMGITGSIFDGPHMIFESRMADVNSVLNKSDLEADYARTKDEKRVFNLSIPAIPIVEKVFEMNIGFTGSFNNSYDIQTGSFKKGARDVTAYNEIDELVNSDDWSDGIKNLFTEAVKSAVEIAKDYVVVKSASIWDGVKNLFCKAVAAVVDSGSESWKIMITTVKADSLHTQNVLLASYGSKRMMGVNSVGDEMGSLAVSLGVPYIVYVTDEDDNVIDDFSNVPVIVTIEYTDEMLSDIGASTEDEKNIEMFKYSEEKCGYVSVGGEVDEENNSVSVTITEPGQFILAINTSSLPVSDEDDNGEKTVSNNNALLSQISQTLAKTSTKSFTAGSDTFTVSWNSFIQFDGRRHNGVGTDASGNPAASKESDKKVSDLKLTITKNGELIDPAKYTVKTKNNKNATVSIDGITTIQTNSKKLPSFTIKFKGKEHKDANKAAKNETFEFGIIPAELKQDLVTFDKVKTGKDGSVQIKQVTFKPEAGASGSPAPKPVKMKYKKQETKTDFVTNVNPDGSVTLTGKNNYYGSVVYKK